MKVVFASNNPGKILEITTLLKNVVDIVQQQEFSVPEIPETGLSFVENALLKARHAARITNLPCIADDSGIVVPYLNGQPGIYSARYAGDGAKSEENNQKLLQALAKAKGEEREACFYCVIVFMLHALDPTPLICEGRWVGEVVTEQQGTKGFGYDPIFFIPELGKTAAELTVTHKNQISHRGRALRSLLDKIRENYDGIVS